MTFAGAFIKSNLTSKEQSFIIDIFRRGGIFIDAPSAEESDRDGRKPDDQQIIKANIPEEYSTDEQSIKTSIKKKTAQSIVQIIHQSKAF